MKYLLIIGAKKMLYDYYKSIKMPKQKKIMLLGGIHYLLPVIKAAHEQQDY